MTPEKIQGVVVWENESGNWQQLTKRHIFVIQSIMISIQTTKKGNLFFVECPATSRNLSIEFLMENLDYNIGDY